MAPLLRRSSNSVKDKPARAFAAVHYRDLWFWIDDGDWQTKRALTAVMFIFTLAGKVVEETADSVVFDSELGGKLCESELTPRTPRP